MAFVYDGTYWRIQDSKLMERMYSAETNIKQTAKAIGLTASETATIANPNLAPLFSSSPYWPAQNSYWVSRENNTAGLFNFTDMGDG